MVSFTRGRPVSVTFSPRVKVSLTTELVQYNTYIYVGGGSIPTQCTASILTPDLIKETQGGPAVRIELQFWVTVLSVTVSNDSITGGCKWFRIVFRIGFWYSWCQTFGF